MQKVIDVLSGSSRPPNVDTLEKLVAERERLEKMLDALPHAFGLHHAACGPEPESKRRKTKKQAQTRQVASGTAPGPDPEEGTAYKRKWILRR